MSELADALWTQGTGATFSASEDRRLIAAVLTPGVSSGLSIAVATGRQVTVSAGAAVVSDGAGGCYIAYMTTATVLTITASSTQNIYIVVDDPGAGGTTVVAGAAPTDPSLVIGSATAGISTISSVSNVRAVAVPPSMATGQPGAPVLASGGTISGPLVLSNTLQTSGLITANGGLYAPDGVRLGSGPATAKHMGAGSSATGTASTGNWDRVNFSTTPYGDSNAYSDYGTVPRPSAGRFNAGVTGDYAVSGHVVLEGNANGRRQLRLAVFKQSDTGGTNLIRTTYGQEMYSLTTNPPTLMMPGMVRMSGDEYFAVEVYQNAGSGLTYTGGQCNFRLIQAG